jgi:3-dehydroquinate dehydratase-2
VKILVMNGPNLAALGRREPDVYGPTTLAELDAACVAWGAAHGAEVRCTQSNDEGTLIDGLHDAVPDGVDGVVLNAGGYTHTSVALRDAIAAIAVPVIEVHLSNVHAREAFRHESLLAPVCAGSITGLGPVGYRAAIEAIARGDVPHAGG